MVNNFYQGPYQLLLLRVKMDLEVTAMKWWSTFPKTTKLDTNRQIQFCV